MTEPAANAKTVLLLVTGHEKFAAAASGQLASPEVEVRAAPLGEARELLQKKDPVPKVALIDWDATAADGSPLCQAVRAAFPDCPIVLLSTREQAAQAVDLVEKHRLCDYLLVDAVEDPGRLGFLVGRARAQAQKPPAKPQPKEDALPPSLIELWAFLQNGEDPVMKLLCKGLGRMNPALFQIDPLRALAEICGQLRRLENHLTTNAASAKPSSAGPILVVEDDEVSGELAKNILEKCGFEAIVVTTISAAKMALVKRRPVLVLMDVYLGDENGLQFVEALRSGTTCPHMPVIVVTSDGMKETVLNAIQADVQGYVLKPYQPRTLISKIKSVLDGSKVGAA